MADKPVRYFEPTKYPLTVPPTGMAVARSGNIFTVSWKIADENYNGGQMFGWCLWTNEKPKIKNSITGEVVVMEKWRYGFDDPVAISNNATSKSLTIDLNAHPIIYGIQFIVYATRGSYDEVIEETPSTIYAHLVSPITMRSVIKWEPKPPKKAKSVTATLSTSNRCRFVWTYEPDDTAREWYTGYEWDSVLVVNSPETDGSKIPWTSTSSNDYRSGSGASATGDVYITEDTTAEGFKTTNTYTRWFRIRAKGPAGYSGYNYAKHVYARPNTATISKTKGTILSGNTSTLVWTKWTLNVTANRPVDEVKVQYLMATPGNNLAAPANGWNDAPGGTITDTSGTDGLTFIIPEVVGMDQCLWTRVTARHDEADYTYSKASRVMVGRLLTPSDLSITEINYSTHKVSIHAVNNSQVPDSFLVVHYTDTKNYTKGADIAIIPHGQTDVTQIQCPNWGTGTASFSVYAVQGSYTSTTKSGVTLYTVTKNMSSTSIDDGGAVPLAPKNVALSLTDIPNTIKVTWSWTWESATFAELSWADHEDAWMSTSGPSTYTINSIQAAAWNISSLDSTKTWYVRVRLGTGSGDNAVYGPYSTTRSINISKEENLNVVFKPVLYLSKTVITPSESFTAFWTYDKSDGASQINADVARVTSGSGGTLSYTKIAHVGAQQSVTISAKKQNWTSGGHFNLALRVSTDLSGQSEWSDPVGITVAQPLSISITNASFVNRSITVDGITRTVTSLTKMPLTFTVNGAGGNGTTSIQIVRSANYKVLRPDESILGGDDGEIVYNYTRLGGGTITVTNGSLNGYLDDGASYRLIVTVTDTVGQREQTSIDFEVHWAHQAVKPNGSVTMDNKHEAAILEPISPSSGLTSTDRCDIYRLSTDKPELVYLDAVFGTKYVDPSPTIGKSGGYRFVFKTENNDVITASNQLAWIDIKAGVDSLYNVITYNGGKARLLYNVDLSSTWTKNFKKTQYLGGSLEGDWNPAVERTGSITGVIVTSDQSEIEDMRRLAAHPGVCRVRTVDGSNYAADVQVTESRGHEALDLVSTFTLNVSKVDQQTYEGIKYSDWEYAEPGTYNLIPYPYYETTKTLNGITFTDIGDGRIKANGTATANAYIYMIQTSQTMQFIEGGKQYRLTGCPSGGSASTYRIYFSLRDQNNTNVLSVYDTGSGGTLNVTSGTSYYGIQSYVIIYSGQTVSNLVFSPTLKEIV